MVLQISNAAIKNPTAVISCIVLTVVIGLGYIFKLPVQLVPDVELDRITVHSNWPGAAPAEVEAQLLKPQENLFAKLTGLVNLEASATYGRSTIVLTLDQKTVIENAILELVNSLNSIPNYPVDADEPVVVVGAGSNATAISWLSISPAEGNTESVLNYLNLIEQVVLPRLERIEGVASSRLIGGRKQVLAIEVDPYKAASFGIEIPQLARQLSRNDNVSAGSIDVGRRKLSLRLASGYDIEQLSQMIISRRDGRIVRLGDIAEVKMDYAKPDGVFSENGGTSIAISIQAVKNVSVLEVMERLKSEVAKLGEGVLKRNGLNIIQVYDETVYINQAIEQVYANLALGIFLAIGILWWFMRQFGATMVVAFCIPLTLFSAFILIGVMGRSINVVSLAGLALSAGLSLDAAIVVFENVMRHFQRGGDREQASIIATRQVTGALIASTLTTVAIFLPIIFTEDTTSQLFSDLAIAITATVVLALFVSVTVIPAMLVRLKSVAATAQTGDRFAELWDRWTDMVIRQTSTERRRWTWLISLVSGAIVLSYLLLPKTDYLPQGNQNSIFAFISPPPGVSLEVAHNELEKTINERMLPYNRHEKQPYVNNYWLGFYGRYGFLGATTVDSDKVGELIDVINAEILKDLPDVRAYASRTSIFGRFSGGRVIDVNVQGTDTENLMEVANDGYRLIGEALPGSSVRPIPGLAFDEPEFRLVPNDRALADNGWDRYDLGKVLNTLGDGLWLGEFFDGSQRLDLKMTSSELLTPRSMLNFPMITANGDVSTIGELADGEQLVSAATIRRINGARTITLQITPPKDLSLEQAIAIIKEKVEPQLAPMMKNNTQIVYEGTAAALGTAISAMGKNVLLAILILYLVIAALFSSFKDSLYVVLTIPLAAVGGFLAIRLTNLFVFQPLDLLTMIGFVILLGMVVNNAILLVAEIRRAAAEHYYLVDAIKQGLRNRSRPIFMTTLTTVFGMLPLLLIPGEGSELYRGLAAIVIGGMLSNVVFTFILVPTLIQLFDSPVNDAKSIEKRPEHVADDRLAEQPN